MQIQIQGFAGSILVSLQNDFEVLIGSIGAIDVNVVVFRPAGSIVISGYRRVSSTAGTAVVQIPFHNAQRTAVLVAAVVVGDGDISSIRHVNFVGITVFHGNGQLLLGVEFHKRGQQPVIAVLGDGDQLGVGEINTCNIFDIQRHLELLKNLGQLNAGLTGDGELCAAKGEIHGKGSKRGETIGLKGDAVGAGDFGIDGADVSVVIHVDNIHGVILVQLHIGNLQLHADRLRGLPVSICQILNGDVPDEQPGILALALLGDKAFHGSGSILVGDSNAQRTALRNAGNTDSGILHGYRILAGQIAVQQSGQFCELGLVGPA